MRKDVCIKGILRKMRKYYKTEFNQITNYIEKGSKKPDEVYSSALTKFISIFFSIHSSESIFFEIDET